MSDPPQPLCCFNGAAGNSPSPKAKINCDQVSWVMSVLERYGDAVRKEKPSLSRLEKAAKTAALLELMEILRLEFKDRSARHNAIAHFGELYCSTEESPA